MTIWGISLAPYLLELLAIRLPACDYAADLLTRAFGRSECISQLVNAAQIPPSSKIQRALGFEGREITFHSLAIGQSFEVTVDRYQYPNLYPYC